MGVAGKIKQLKLQPARIHSVGGYANAPLWMVCSSKEMVTATVKSVDLGSARSIMEAVGMSPEMDTPSLPVQMLMVVNANALLGLKVMVLKVV